MRKGMVLALGLGALLLQGAPKVDEKVRNERVIIREITLAPGESESIASEHPSVTVYFDEASFDVTASAGKARRMTASRGEAVFEDAGARIVRNTGSAPLHYIRTELLNPGSGETWGRAGLAPHYKVLIENRYARVYDIRIPAHTNEPQHTHHDRVVVCLTGATLRHRFPDGSEEPSTLKTGETGWRRGSTHIGQNLGDTDFWTIAIEPK